MARSRVPGPQDPRSAQLTKDLKAAAELTTAEDEHSITEAARLLMRYQYSHPEAFGRDCRSMVLVWLERMGLTMDELFLRSRAIWAAGYRPQRAILDYGSGADTSSG